jgi:predicted hotdog family 3-hydroxylacyl-ACP dehydratase
MNPASFDVSALLPHGAAARFVQEVVSVEPESIVTRGAIPAHGPFVKDGVAPAVVALELAAQSAGLLEAISRDDPAGTTASVGYIVGLRELSMSSDAVPARREMTATVTLDGAARPLTIYRVSVSLDGVEVVTGKINIFTA